MQTTYYLVEKLDDEEGWLPAIEVESGWPQHFKSLTEAVDYMGVKLIIYRYFQPRFRVVEVTESRKTVAQT